MKIALPKTFFYMILFFFSCTKIYIFQLEDYYSIVYELGHEKMCLMSYVNNKGVDQFAA